MLKTFLTVLLHTQHQKIIESLPISEPKTEIKQKRRSRYDQKGRIHKCGCGKAYLSYPALFTHIKTKHDRQNPDCSDVPRVKARSKRRSLPKIINTNRPAKIAKPESAAEINERQLLGDEASYLREIGCYSSHGTDATENFPRIFKNHREYEHTLLPILKEIMLSETNKNGENTEKEYIGADIFAKFLLNHAKVCQKDFYNELVLFIVLLYKFLDEEVAEGFLSTNNCEEVPCYLPRFMVYLDAIKCEFDKAKLLELVNHFIEWLYSHKYTHMRVIYN
ncbi:unnamed protein product [Blepharisma stoltei]|uniref:C2H2-type domain-containing protein n=1 Tax=Blepharisma stoltei TaxID=1481888 RepID=A0AAU9IQJ1_9CILI|nr:unnamed protein product [Blepharisma stoltei]